MSGTPAPKRYFRGTHRVCEPAATRERVSPLLARAGITRVADVTQLDILGIPVMQAVRPGSRNLSVSQGKALTRDGAWVSAVMESLELWHAECLDHVPQVTMPLREMRYDNPVPAESLKWRADTMRLDAAPMAWVAAKSLTGERHGWLPRRMLEIDYSFPDRFRPGFFHVTSNGLASGNTPEEALVHALCELIERHGLHLRDADVARCPAIDPATIDVPDALDLLDRLHRAGMRVALHDVTWEAGIPAVMADVVAADLPTVWRGAGCHPDPGVALTRALTEAVQSRLTYIAGARDDLTQFADDASAARRFAEFTVPEPGRAFGDLPRCATGTVDGDLDLIVRSLGARSLEPFIVDLTRDDVGIPVVFAFVPGLGEAHYA